jgi:hypothetical protein
MATYSILPQLSIIDEGQILQTVVQTTGVVTNTSLWWSVSGSGVTAADFSLGTLLGTGKVGANGQLSFSHTLALDKITEGTENLEIKLFSNAARTLQVGSTAIVSIRDTSLSPPPTYAITPAFASRNEGLVITTTVNTTNAPVLGARPPPPTPARSPPAPPVSRTSSCWGTASPALPITSEI